MKFYRRYNADDSCTIICLRCFSNLGTARGGASAAEIEGQHDCRQVAARDPITGTESSFLQRLANEFACWAKGLPRGSAALLIVLCVLLLYLAPTMIELGLRPYVNGWIGIVLFGDLIGCLCLAVFFGSPRSWLLLYLGLTLSEAVIFSSGAAPRRMLAWIVDLVPTAIAACRLAQIRLAGPAPDAPPRNTVT